MSITRAVRSGITPFTPERFPLASDSVKGAGKILRNVVATLAQQLDAVAADRIATERERQQDSGRRIAEAKAALRNAAVAIGTQVDEVDRAYRAIEKARHDAESKLSPLAIERVRQIAQDIREGRRESGVAQAVARRDTEALMAASLLADHSGYAIMGLGTILAPAAMAKVHADGRAALQLRAALAGVTAAFDMMAVDQNAYAAVVDPMQFLAAANGDDFGYSAAAQLPDDWGPWVRALVTRPDSDSAPPVVPGPVAAEPAGAGEGAAAAAGGAA